MNGLISAIKAFVLKNRPAYKDYLGNGKYDVKKLPEECVPDSVNTNIRTAQNKADSAYDKADSAYDEASSAYGKANLAYDKASDINSRLFTLTNLNYNFKTFEHAVAKEPNIRIEVADTNGISDIPFAESTAPMKCHFDIVLKDSNNNQIGRYAVFDRKIVRGITKISETYRLFIDERVKLGSDGYAELKIGYWLNSNDNLWRKDIGVVISLPSTDIDNSNISTVFIKAYGDLVDVDNYAPWPSICVPLAGTNDAGVVYASDKTDDQTVPVSIDKNGYLWCKDAGIINSSTPDSTKKFKITIGDDARPTFTDTSDPNNTWTPGDSSRYIINGHSWNYNGVNYICTDETPDQLQMMYESGKDIFLYFNKERFKYTGRLFYTIVATSGDNTGIKGAAIAVIGTPMTPNISWNCPYKGVCNFGVFPFNIQPEG